MSQQPISPLYDPFLDTPTPRGGEPALLCFPNVASPTCAVYHYDLHSGGLVPWAWSVSILYHHFFSYSLDRPVNDMGERVMPSDLSYHRRSRHFRGPCCLCAAENPMLAHYTEAAIFCSPFGVWVAACARSRCLYWGKFLVFYVCITADAHLSQP
jgi:hypothetical protein